MIEYKKHITKTKIIWICVIIILIILATQVVSGIR